MRQAGERIAQLEGANKELAKQLEGTWETVKRLERDRHTAILNWEKHQLRCTVMGQQLAKAQRKIHRQKKVINKGRAYLTMARDCKAWFESWLCAYPTRTGLVTRAIVLLESLKELTTKR